MNSAVQSLILCVVWSVMLTSALTAQDIPSADEIGVVDVLQSEDAALAEIYPNADSARAHRVLVDSMMSAALHARLGRLVRDSQFTCFEVYESGKRFGVAIIADEQGKYRPITFMAGVDDSHHIVDVRVLVYRESRGGEVRQTRFLKQYRGKSLESPIRINRDIVNITGATISVNSLNAGVRKALAVAEYLNQNGGFPR